MIIEIVSLTHHELLNRQEQTNVKTTATKSMYSYFLQSADLAYIFLLLEDMFTITRE